MRFKKLEIDPNIIINKNNERNEDKQKKDENKGEILSLTLLQNTLTNYQNKKLYLLKNIDKKLGILIDSKEENDFLKTRSLKFKYAALILDRFFFWLSVFYFIITFSSLVLSIPNFYMLQG